MTDRRDRVVVGRKWNNPNIYTLVESERIEMRILLDDFINALAVEMGSPAFLMTKAGLKERLKLAATAALDEIKKASAQVV
jgi:hypothetical protein